MLNCRKRRAYIKDKLTHVAIWIPPILYAALIFFISSRSRVPRFLPTFCQADKLLHSIEYGVFGFLIFRSIQMYPEKCRPIMVKFIVGLIIIILYGVSDEIHQHFVPGRDASILDVMADIVGGSFGMLVAIKMYRKRRL